MKYISLLLSFLILSTSVFGQASRTQYFDAANYNFGQTGNVSKSELFNLQGSSSNIQTQLNGKEALSNKATSLASPDNTKYPTTQAVSTGLSTGLATKEDTANKATSLASPDNVKFPTTQAVATGLGLKQDTITGAASTITSSNLSTSKAMVTDGSGKAAASATVDTTELGYLDGVTSSVQTQINTNSTNISGKITGPASSTDTGILIYNGTTGKIAKDSNVTIDSNGVLTTAPTATSGIYNQGKDLINIAGDGALTTGSNATIDISGYGLAAYVVSPSLVSISNISPFPSGAASRRFTIINNTGNSITIVNDTTTGTPTTGIYTGTGSDITLGNRASLTFLYNSTRWIVVGGSGSGGSGPSDLDIAFSQDFESAKLTDFTQTGLTIDTTSQVHLKKSALLTHNASTVQSFKQVIAVDPKFRGKSLTLKVDCKSTATSGNVTVSVFDETNSTSLLGSTQIACGSTIDSYYASYTTASTTASISYTVSALVQAGSPVTYVDDIVSFVSKNASLSTSITVPKPVLNHFSAKISSTAAVSDSVKNIISSCSLASTTFTCNFAGLVSPPTCSFGTGPLGTQAQITSITSSQIVFSTYNASGTPTAISTQINCDKTGADWIDPTTSTQSQSIQLTQSALVQTPDSSLVITKQKQMASTNTKIVCYDSTSILKNIGDSVKYESDTVLGDRFTALRDGVYNISATVSYVNTSTGAMITLNQTDFTSDANNISASQVVSTSYSAVSTSNFDSIVSASVYLNTGDVVRISQMFGPNSINSGASAGRGKFSMTYQGSLKQASINTNSKIKIPTSELRFEGANSQGTGSQSAVVKFNSITKLRGDAFSINPDGADTTFGTHVRMLKAGWLNVSSSATPSAAGNGIFISKNQAALTTTPAQSEIIAVAFQNGAGNYTVNASGPTFVNVGDTIRVVASSSMPATANREVFTLTFQEQDIQVSVSNTLPQFTDTDSSYRVDTANGYGSTTGTMIRRFSAVRENIGSDVNCQDSSTAGLSCTAMTSGVYSISYTDSFSAADYLGITRNSANLTTGISTVGTSTPSEVLSIVRTNVAGATDTASWQGYLSAGDIIRPHTNGTSAGSVLAHFTMSKVGKPNITTDVSAFVNMPTIDVETIEALAQTTTFGSTNTGVPVFAISKNTNKGIISVDSSSTLGTSFRALQKCSVNITGSASDVTGAATIFITKNATTLTAATPDTWHAMQTVTVTNNGSVSGTINLEVGDVLRVQRDSVNINSFYRLILTANANPSQIVTPVESFSTDANQLTWAVDTSYSLATLPNSTKGTYITWAYGSGWSLTQCTTVNGRPTQTDSDMAANGILMYAKTYASSSNCQQPARVAINIGKGFKGKLATIYKSAGKTTTGSIDWQHMDSTLSIGAFTYYDEKNGILIVDSGFNWFSTTSTHTFQFSDNTQQTTGYVVINASKTPTLSGVSYVAPRVAWLSDQKTSGTNGQALTGATWNTRTITTEVDTSDIVSLSGSTFTLQAGTYYIEGSAPAYLVNAHKARIRNTSDGATVVQCTSQQAGSATAGATTVSDCQGEFTITSAKAFELQHWAQTTNATNGGGLNASTGEVETYSTLKITKVK